VKRKVRHGDHLWLSLVCINPEPVSTVYSVTVLHIQIFVIGIGVKIQPSQQIVWHFEVPITLYSALNATRSACSYIFVSFL